MSGSQVIRKKEESGRRVLYPEKKGEEEYRPSRKKRLFLKG